MVNPKINKSLARDDTPVQLNKINKAVFTSSQIWVAYEKVNKETNFYVTKYLKELNRKAVNGPSFMVNGKVLGSLCTKKNCRCKNNTIRKVYVQEDLHYVELPARRGSFELYFMGVRMYSKCVTGMWPDLDRLANLAKQAYDDFYANPAFDLYRKYDCLLNDNKSL